MNEYVPFIARTCVRIVVYNISCVKLYTPGLPRAGRLRRRRTCLDVCWACVTVSFEMELFAPRPLLLCPSTLWVRRWPRRTKSRAYRLVSRSQIVRLAQSPGGGQGIERRSFRRRLRCDRVRYRGHGTRIILRIRLIFHIAFLWYARNVDKYRYIYMVGTQSD